MSSIPVTLRMARASARAQPQGKSKRPGRADQRVREAGIVGWRLERGVILSVERSVDPDSGAHRAGSGTARLVRAARHCGRVMVRLASTAGARRDAARLPRGTARCIDGPPAAGQRAITRAATRSAAAPQPAVTSAARRSGAPLRRSVPQLARTRGPRTPRARQGAVSSLPPASRHLSRCSPSQVTCSEFLCRRQAVNAHDPAPRADRRRRCARRERPGRALEIERRMNPLSVHARG